MLRAMWCIGVWWIQRVELGGKRKCRSWEPHCGVHGLRWQHIKRPCGPLPWWNKRTKNLIRRWVSPKHRQVLRWSTAHRSHTLHQTCRTSTTMAYHTTVSHDWGLHLHLRALRACSKWVATGGNQGAHIRQGSHHRFSMTCSNGRTMAAIVENGTLELMELPAVIILSVLSGSSKSPIVCE
jgi:hypothetical protein